jgi:hypothetical protein
VSKACWPWGLERGTGRGVSGNIAGITVGLTGAFSSAATVAAAVVAVIVFIVIAIVTAVFYTINFLNALWLSGQLAELIASTPTTAPDLGAIMGDSSKVPTLYSLFVAATLLTPSNTTCDNSLVGIAVPCLNAPPVASPSPSDPEFAIQQQGATTTTDASSISWKDTKQTTTTTARLSGNWFVDQVTGSSGTASITQTLQIEYTDWNGTDRTAYLFDFPTDGYKFLGYTTPDPSKPPINWSTCVSDGTCFYSPTIDYVGTDGKNYSAKVVATAPVVAPTRWRAAR